MTSLPADPSLALARLVGVDLSFDRLLEQTLDEIREGLCVPRPGEPGAPVDPRIEAEFTAARLRLEAFRPEHEAILTSWVASTVTGGSARHLLEVLTRPDVVQGLAALEASRPEASAALDGLARKMSSQTLRGFLAAGDPDASGGRR